MMTHEQVRAINKKKKVKKTMEEDIQPVDEAIPAVEEEVFAPETEEVAEETA